MQWGMFTCGYQRYPLDKAFADAREFGYDYIELWGGRPHAFAPDLMNGELDHVRALIEQYEMPVWVYTPEHNAYPYNYMIGSELQRKDALSYLKCALDAGKALGAEYTLVSAGHAGEAATPKQIRQRLVLSLQELASHAERIGHTIVLETLTPYETNACITAEDLKEVLDAVDSEYLMGMCDIVVPFVCNEPILGYLDKLGPRMRHLHIVDSDGVSDSHLVPGDGCIPLAEVLAGLHAYDYKGRATIELVTAYMDDPSYYAKLALDRIRAIEGGTQA